MFRLTSLFLILALLFAACLVPPPVFPARSPSAVQTEVAPPMQQTPRAALTSPAIPTRTPALSRAETGSTATRIPTFSSSPVSPATPTTLPTAQSFLPEYTVQAGTPVTATNFLHPVEDCNWIGLSGQVFGGDGSPVTGLDIEVRGVVDDRDILALGLTGVVSTLGLGGYAVKVQDTPVQTRGELQVQVFKDGQPLSEPISFSLSPGCENSLVLLNFVPAGASPQKELLFIPNVLTGVEDAP